MIPILSKRAEMPGGSWTNKLGGEFQDGDASTSFFFEGRADIKELGGHLRIFFKDIAVVKRPMEVSEARRAEMLEAYRKERKDKRRIAYGPDADSSSDEEEDIKKEREDREINMLVQEEKEKPVVMPKISIYLTTKKPKTRMVDAHKTGCKVFIGTNVEVPFGKVDTIKSYEAPLRDIIDISGFQGLVALKLPQDEPVTENPVIYGLIKLMSYRSMKKRTVEALHLADLNEEIEHILLNRKEDPSADKSPNKQKAAAAVVAVAVPTAVPVASAVPEVRTANGRNATDNIKSLSVYRKAASKTWLHFQLPETEEVDFFMFLKMLDFNDLFLIRTQAIRIFNAIDIQGDHWLGISEFENCLMALDMLGNSGPDLVLLDVFDSLKSLPLKQVISDAYDKKVEGTPTKEGAAAAAAKVEKPKPKVIPGDKNTTPQFLMTKEILESCNNPLMGLDYSAYCEAIQMLGVPTTLEDEQRRESFMFGGNVNIRGIESKYLNVAEFRKAWLKVADLQIEMEVRGMKFEIGVFAQARNRDRLSRAMETVEAAYLSNLKKANEVVENVKHERRIKKDKKRSDFEAHRAKLLHEANKFIAVRGQEKRLLIKKEQEEKSKKRNEDKILRNKLLLRQQENLQQKRLEISAANQEKEKLRVAEIKARGWDKIDRSVQSMRHVDPALYTTPEAQSRLQYALLIDFSHNLLDALPPDNFLYWMSECKKFKLSENRLRVIPVDINNMGNLEILEMDTNRIESLPNGLCELRNLQRLDISNNQLHSLPEAIGNCGSLRYFCAHSNHLAYIPTSIGQCYKLEYIDFSRNQLAELPEDMQNLMSLTHLDCNSNRLGILPNNLGDCTKMLYLDMSTNLIAILPPSFSRLNQLEYCNFENNSVIVTKNSFNTCSALKYMNFRKNHCDRLYSDIGKAINLSFLDCSVNAILSIPLEMGLLVQLQELNLSHNRISTIPPELGSCVKLQRLEMPHNEVVGMLPETIGLIHSLVYLDISFNQVDQLPRSVIGLMNLVELRAERCCLMELPDTITYLDNLKLLDVSNNQFRRFPIELQYMKSLKTLNLANNALTLLPRNINAMTSLDTLDLSRNKIRALPVEFTDILESVGTVELHTNPWTDLPPRWGKLWPGTHATQGPLGYNLSEAVDFLYGMRSFYNTAEEIWLELGMFHYAGRLGFEDFLQELRNRIPKTWHEGLVDYAKHIYFRSREAGIFVRWYMLDEATTEENKAKVEADRKRREYNVQKSKDELEMKHALGKIVYSGDMNRKIRHVNELAIEHEKSQEVVNHIHMTNLYGNVKAYEKTAEKRHKQRENWFERRRMAEMRRLDEILGADKEGREADRQYRKENRDELNPYVKSYVA